MTDEYIPDSWVIVKLPNIDSDGHFYKVVAGWSGGYLWGNSWRVNSGVTSLEKDGEHYLAHGNSGSVYRLWQEREGERMSMIFPLIKLKESGAVVVPVEEVYEVLRNGK
jgi:hypothetical protein